MKKTRKILLTVLSVLTVAAVLLGVASCDLIEEYLPSIIGPSSSFSTDSFTEDSSLEDGFTEDSSLVHTEHTWEENYRYDESYHWIECTVCHEIKDKAEHTLDEMGECTVCKALVRATEGILYEVSSDSTYAKAIGYEGAATRVKIADFYNGLPVRTICERVFYENNEIISVIIPDSVTSIGAQAFCDCSKLTSVEISDSVISIGDGAFEKCSSLTSVVIPNSVTSIGGSVFNDCSRLENITVSEGNGTYQSIDGNLYSKDGITLIQYAIGKEATSFITPDGVISIGNLAFCGCSKLTNVVISDSVTSIGETSFGYCENLTSVVIGNNVASIGYGAFTGCISLTRVVIGDSVTSIDNGAFCDCSSLTSVVIGDSVISIGDAAFSGCSSLTSVMIPDSVTSISLGAFAYCGSLTNIEVSVDNADYQSIDGNLYTKDGTTLIQYAIGKTATSFTVPNSVTSIGGAFSGCSSLTSVVISNNVTSIGYAAFDGCSSLTSIYYKGTASEWSEISIYPGGNSELTYVKRYYYSETEPTSSGRYWHYVDGVPTVW